MVDELTANGPGDVELKLGRQVVWDAPAAQWAAGRRARTKTVKAGSAKQLKQFKWWLVRSIILATTVFALLDLYLLAPGSHH